MRAGPTGFGERGRSALPAATIEADPEGRRGEGPIVATAGTTWRGGGQDASRASELGVRSLVVFFLLAFGTSWAAWALPVVPTLGPMIAAVIVTP